MGMIQDHVFKAYGMPVPSDLRRFGSGLIHDTYWFSWQQQSFLIQRLNQEVFKDLPGIMNNIELLTHYLQEHFKEITFVEFVKSTDYHSLVYHEGEAWRLMRFIPESVSYDQVSALGQANEAGRIIGKFHSMCIGFNTQLLVETIPGFHDYGARLKSFLYAQELDEFHRAIHCKKEIDYLNVLGNEVHRMELEFDLPQRVSHNDTKLNNILFDPSGQAICIVDLDTLMPGNITIDTGDALRTMCNLAGEDGLHGAVTFSKEIFYAFAQGFIQSSHQHLSLKELKSLPFSIQRMASEQAIRFLTDYLQGDRYYKQLFEGFNLKATRVQIELLQLVEKEKIWMHDVIEDLLFRLD